MNCMFSITYVHRLFTDFFGSYLRYQERKAETDAKYKAKKARKEHEDGEWTGFSDGEMSIDEDNEVVEHEVSSDSESDDEEEEGKQLVKKLDGADIKGEDGLSKRAALFFDQDIFAGISEDEGDDEEEAEGDETFDGFDSEGEEEDEEGEADVEMEGAQEEDESEDEGIEFVKAPKDERWDADEEPMKDGRPGTYPPSLVSPLQHN
jgi:AdoMet-dependent rRNA methyltransferase SPB1